MLYKDHKIQDGGFNIVSFRIKDGRIFFRIEIVYVIVKLCTETII